MDLTVVGSFSERVIVVNKDHSNRLGLFSWIYAGILAASLTLNIVTFIYFYGSWIGTDSIPSFGELLSVGDSPYATKMVILFLLVVFGLLLALLLMLVIIILNIRLGKALRKGPQPTHRRLVVISILNLITSVVGGFLHLPFGVALGIYGLWYAFSGSKQIGTNAKAVTR